MTLEILLRYVHFISIFAIVGSLVSEHLLLKKSMTRAEIARVARIDAVYGIAALTLVTAGLTLWLGSVGKPSWFYSKNWIFHTKITLVAIVGLLSIYPTVFFLRNRKGRRRDGNHPCVCLHNVADRVGPAFHHSTAGGTHGAWRGVLWKVGRRERSK